MFHPISAASYSLRHGSLVVDSELRVYQVLGLPAPEGYAVVMPKYVPCNSTRTPWRLGVIRLCRVLDAYTAKSIRSAARRAGSRILYDPLYGAPIPIIEISSARCTVSPEDALERIIRHPRSMLEDELVGIVHSLREAGFSGMMGVTGSLALGFHSEAVSDIDLVVYGDRAVERMLEAFSSLRGEPQRSLLSRVGGVRVMPPTDLSWRRLVLNFRGKRILVSWSGASTGIAEHCPPLREWRRLPQPEEPVSLETVVEPGQPGALQYPPCVETIDNSYIISFEFNVGMYLYIGGRVRVEGLATKARDSIILGAGEYPGGISLIGGGKYIGGFR
jgi:predicted nucleotidyltransferase